ncbi:CPBP family intramembrane glutamic endopeptidase [Confluentibacter sediminis]|uniref:CPBP family intramembrane glutamic endopeptidase n=1 Tax=Confluentibacter sediminis TaxID=2219045 RepID=UPI000DACF9BE|nr:CPBP family intramembrane glutamic endopeptidase [Confluentibacter sediminis]
MEKLLIKNIAQLLIVLPLIIYTLKKSHIKWSALLLFCLFFLQNQLLLELPREFEFLNIIEGNWNWSGKIYAMAGSLLFYWLFKKEFSEHDFFKIKQARNSIRPNIITTLIVMFLAVALAFFLFGKSEPDTETLLFQLTMPGFDEEIAFRGIMLGLLSTVLNETIDFGFIKFGNPAILITSILFGLIHSFGIDEQWHIAQDWIYFSQTFLYGLVLGWMTIKSRSILMPIISHNLTNTVGTIITWIK